MIRTVRRSSARDLPPAADAFDPAVIVSDPAPKLPAAGAHLCVRVPCGLDLRVRVVSSEMTETGWMAWAQQLDDTSADYRRLGVPQPIAGDNFRIFSWQVVNR